jgi:hypothetical protein
LLQQTIVSSDEDIFDITLLVGGTINQEVHYDFPRITAADFDGNTIAFEVNRKKYNEDMSSELAPSSILLDITAAMNGIKIGILREFVVAHANNDCSVKRGKADETFKIVSYKNENHETCILHYAQGFGIRFVGDFPHFGVRNAPNNDETIDHAVKALDSAKGKAAQLKALSKIRNLDRICRLFMKTKPKTACMTSYSLDAVGFVRGSKSFSTNYAHLIAADTSNNENGNNNPTSLIATQKEDDNENKSNADTDDSKNKEAESDEEANKDICLDEYEYKHEYQEDDSQSKND